MLQNNSSLTDVNIQVRVWENSVNQQGFCLYNKRTTESYIITEDEISTDIVIYRVEGKSKKLNLAQRHNFDRNFYKATDWLLKELNRYFPKWEFEESKRRR